MPCGLIHHASDWEVEGSNLARSHQFSLFERRWKAEEGERRWKVETRFDGFYITPPTRLSRKNLISYHDKVIFHKRLFYIVWGNWLLLPNPEHHHWFEALISSWCGAMPPYNNTVCSVNCILEILTFDNQKDLSVGEPTSKNKHMVYIVQNIFQSLKYVSPLMEGWVWNCLC